MHSQTSHSEELGLRLRRIRNGFLHIRGRDGGVLVYDDLEDAHPDAIVTRSQKRKLGHERALVLIGIRRRLCTEMQAVRVIEARLQVREMDIGSSLVGEAMYLSQSEQASGPSQATLLAAMGVEVHTKTALRAQASDAQRPILDLLLGNPTDWSLAAHALFQKAIPVTTGRELGQEHKDQAKRVQNLFAARNHVAHRGEVIDRDTARAHVATAYDALTYLDAF